MAGQKSDAAFVIGGSSANCRLFASLPFLASRSRPARIRALRRRGCCADLLSIQTSNRREHIVPRTDPPFAARATALLMIFITICRTAKIGGSEMFSIARNLKLKGPR
jgi:hypothetical protein